MQTPSNHRVRMNVGCLYLIPLQALPTSKFQRGCPLGPVAGGQVQDAHWRQGTEELVLPSLGAPSQNSSKCNIVLYRRDLGQLVVTMVEVGARLEFWSLLFPEPSFYSPTTTLD